MLSQGLAECRLHQEHYPRSRSARKPVAILAINFERAINIKAAGCGLTRATPGLCPKVAEERNNHSSTKTGKKVKSMFSNQSKI